MSVADEDPLKIWQTAFDELQRLRKMFHEQHEQWCEARREVHEAGNRLLNATTAQETEWLAAENEARMKEEEEAFKYRSVLRGRLEAQRRVERREWDQLPKKQQQC